MRMKRRRGKDRPQKERSLKKGVLKLLKILFLYIPLLLFFLSLVSVIILKWVPIPYTPLMAIRSFEYRDDDSFKTIKHWVQLKEISPNMIMAVIASEDNRFEEHKGFDWVEINKAIADGKKGKRMRGASTISQQTAKNVFLTPSRSWIRKGLEAYFTTAIELIWGKQRIMEVYLNVAEMGKGIYGAEAAANELFKKTAQKLTVRESALIAATLPNPLQRKANTPSAYMSSRARDIEVLMAKVKRPDWIGQ